MSWFREQLIRLFQAATLLPLYRSGLEKLNYGSHTHTLINPRRHAQLGALSAVSGTLSQRDTSGKVSIIISSGIIRLLTESLE